MTEVKIYNVANLDEDALIFSKTKSVMALVRIELAAIAGLDKTKITSIKIDFGTFKGKVALNNFEFTL